MVAPGVAYRVERELGRGGMGCTYKATNLVLNTPCVVKTLRDDAAQTSDYRARFLREAQIAAQIGRHPNLVTVVHFGQFEAAAGATPKPFYTMDWVHGVSLRDLLARSAGRQLPLRLSLQLGVGILYGISRLHERGVLHRDIKPDNVLVTKEPGAPSVPKIIDLGAASLLDDPDPSDRVLTASYAAPEQIGFETLGPTVDVFACALTLYEMLTGRHPYAAYGNSLQGMAQRFHEPVAPLSTCGIFPAALELALARALALDASQRSGCFELLHALQDLGNSLEQDPASTSHSTSPDPLPPEPEQRIRRKDLANSTQPDGAPYVLAARPSAMPAPAARAFTSPMVTSFVGLVKERAPTHERPTTTYRPPHIRAARDTALVDDVEVAQLLSNLDLGFERLPPRREKLATTKEVVAPPVRRSQSTFWYPFVAPRKWWHSLDAADRRITARLLWIPAILLSLSALMIIAAIWMGTHR